MNKISLKIGSKVYYENKEYEISNQISTKEILGKEVEFPYEFKVLKIQNLKSKPDTIIPQNVKTTFSKSLFS